MSNAGLFDLAKFLLGRFPRLARFLSHTTTYGERHDKEQPELIATLCLHRFPRLAISAGSAQEPPKESKGQKVVELRSIDLTSEIDSNQGRRLRMRLITAEADGVVALHSHQDRPTLIHIKGGSALTLGRSTGSNSECRRQQCRR
jgi:hypothetical protein